MVNYYPPVSFYFEARIANQAGGADASFAEVSGLDAEREISEIKEGGENRFAHRVPGRGNHGNLVLKRGLMLASSALFDWCKTVLEDDLDSAIETKNVSVSLLSPEGSPLINWNITRAWPVKWQVAAFKARESEIAMETLELAYAQVTREVVKQQGLTGSLDAG